MAWGGGADADAVDLSHLKEEHAVMAEPAASRPHMPGRPARAFALLEDDFGGSPTRWVFRE